MSNNDEHRYEDGFNREYYGETTLDSKDDKLWFYKKIPDDVDVVMDFGTATGKVLKAWQELDKERGISREYVGYDIDDKMIELAISECGIEKIQFTHDLDNAVKLVDENGGKSVLILSSVIHEVMGEGSTQEKEDFWEFVLSKGFDYIAIREFGISKDLGEYDSPKEIVDNLRQQYADRVFGETHPLVGQNVLEVWEKGFDPLPEHKSQVFQKGFEGWGGIDKYDSLVHFLLTFDNIEEHAKDLSMHIQGARELTENYLSTTMEDISDKLSITDMADDSLRKESGEYKVQDFLWYKDPFRREVISDLLGINEKDLDKKLVETTSLKPINFKMQVILEKRGASRESGFNL